MILYYDIEEGKYYTESDMEYDLFFESDMYEEGESYTRWLDEVLGKNGTMLKMSVSIWLMDNVFIITENNLKKLLEADGVYPCYLESELEDMLANGTIKPWEGENGIIWNLEEEKEEGDNKQ